MSGKPISAVLLAAGAARRMDGEKLLLDLDGEALVRRVAGEAAAVPVGEVVVIVNERNRAAIADALAGVTVRLEVNERAGEGMGTSIALGAASVSAASEALLLLQADQPLVDRVMLRALVEEWKKSSPAFVASSYDGVVTTPVLFAKRLFAELRVLGGDRGARTLLDRHAGEGRVLPFPSWRGSDVDTPEDYRRVREQLRTAGER